MLVFRGFTHDSLFADADEFEAAPFGGVGGQNHFIALSITAFITSIGSVGVSWVCVPLALALLASAEAFEAGAEAFFATDALAAGGGAAATCKDAEIKYCVYQLTTHYLNCQISFCEKF
jgi:hypothetical protein